MSNDFYVFNDLSYENLIKTKESIRAYIKRQCNIKKGIKAAVKLNLVGPFAPEKAATTHPAIVELIIQVLSEFSCEILLCEDIESKDILVKTGIEPVLKKYGLPFYSLREYGYEEYQVGSNTYLYSSFLLQADLLIDVPKFKTHMLTAFTGAIKNFYGAIKKSQRKELHISSSDEFLEHICNIYSIRIPDLVIMDAIVGMEGLGPSIGKPKYMGMLFVGTDGVKVDYYACKSVGYEVEKLGLLQCALKEKLYRTSPDSWDEQVESEVSNDFSKIPLFEGKAKEKYINVLKHSYRVNTSICIKCRKCQMNCPFGAITFDEYPIFDHDKCALCTCCMELCPVNAINY